MNKYDRIKQIGEGAFGKAVLVRRKDNSKQCVIKEVNMLKMSAKEKEDARKEVAVLAQLKHPNIVSYIESFEEKGSLYICMNFCSGGDLYGKINERRGMLFSEGQILDWFVQLCLAVKHIHDRKILHRDIKSQNIFLTNHGTMQLGDFGIAKVLNSTAQLAHTCIGTPYYLSPEIVENMPYNNKSDIWSMGCVLYELTTLKHAFEAANMKNLVLKIVRGSYPPVSSQFSYDLRGLIAQLFKRSPRDRPSVNSILRKNFVMQRVRRLLSAEDLADEFSHTVMHGHKIAKALPAGPKPSADPSKKPAPSSRPGSANKRYDPAAVYGVNVSRSRQSGDQKKRPSTPNRSVPGAADWDKKKKERMDLEQKRRIEMKKREQEMNERRHRELIDRQKNERIKKAREEGWKNLADPHRFDLERENQAKTPSPRPLPVPRPHAERDRGNYEAYNNFLDNLHKPKTPSPVPAGPVRNENRNHIEVINVAPRPLPRNQPHAVQQMPQRVPMAAQGGPNKNFNMGPLGVPAALDQAGRDRYSYNMQKGAQAAQRARVVEDYVERQREAMINKKRAQHDLYGHRPSSAGQRTPVPAPFRGPSPGPRGRGDDGRGRGGGGGAGGGGGGGGVGAYGRNRDEQEYLEKLRQIRLQNMKDRRALQGGRSPADEQKIQEAEERKKKAEALKNQAEEWADKKKKELERRKMELFQGRGISPLPSPSPGPAVPITGALHVIGAGDKAVKAPVLGDGDAKAPVQLTNAMQNIGAAAAPRSSRTEESERPKSAHQKRKEGILRKLNDKSPSRGKWGAPPTSPVVAMSKESARSKWGAPASPLIVNEVIDVDAEPESSRSQWGDRKSLHLTDVPLEQTGSHMEATSSADQVVKLVDDKKQEEERVNAGGNRSQWGRHSAVVKALDQMPVCQATITLSDSNASATTIGSSSGPPVGIGETVTLAGPVPLKPSVGGPAIKGAMTSPSQFKRPLPLPPERSGTIIISRDQTAVPAYTIPTVSPMPKPETRLDKQIVSKESNVKTQTTADEDELPSSMRFLEKEENTKGDGNVFSKEGQQLSVLVEVSESQSLSQTQQLKVEKAFAVHLAQMNEEKNTSGKGLTVRMNENAGTGTEKKLDLIDRDGAKSVQQNLCTGQFDMKNVTLLRTCSEPDLSSLFRTLVPDSSSDDIERKVLATIKRRHSLDLDAVIDENEDDDDDNFDQIRSQYAAIGEDEFAEEDIKIPDDGSDNDDDMDDDDEDDDGDDEGGDGEDDDEDLLSMRETMQSLLVESDEDENNEKKINFRLSSDSTDGNSKSSTLKSSGKSSIQGSSSKKQAKTRRPLVGDGGDVDVVDDGYAVAGDDDEDDEENEDAREREELASVLELDGDDESDDETTFGDDGDEEPDYDRFGRLEQCRAELESELGIEKLVAVYQIIQELQEDEDGNMEEGTKVAMKMLGADKEHLFPKIFQLVMSDTAFTEDNE